MTFYPRRHAILLLLACAAATVGAQNRADDAGLSRGLPDTIDLVRPTVVRVKKVCLYQAGARTFEEGSGGTGFWISDAGFTLTAAHVISACSARPQGGPGALEEQTYYIGLALRHTATDQTDTRENFRFIEAEIVEADLVHDVALLKARPNPFRERVPSGFTLNRVELELPPPQVARLSSRQVREGEAIAISGYPLSQSVFDTNAGIVASIHSDRDILSPPQISGNEVVQTRLQFDVYEADMSINPGNSGGPVYYAASGDVIGICSAYRVAPGGNSGLSIIVPIAYGGMLMSKHGLAASQSGGGTPHQNWR
jgi:S1-C subfamily serine protease